MDTKLMISMGYEYLVTGIFMSWFVLTVICQFRDTKASSFIKYRIDVFGLIPLWTFFAPSPGKRDYHLLYRDKIDEQTNTEWQEMDMTEERSFWSWFWNPEKRDKKVLSDVVQNLISSIPHYRDENNECDLLMFSMPYIIVLNAISRCQSTRESPYRQFMLAESSGYQKEVPPAVILLSVFHQI